MDTVWTLCFMTSAINWFKSYTLRKHLEDLMFKATYTCALHAPDSIVDYANTKRKPCNAGPKRQTRRNFHSASHLDSPWRSQRPLVTEPNPWSFQVGNGSILSCVNGETNDKNEMVDIFAGQKYANPKSKHLGNLFALSPHFMLQKALLKFWFH